MEAGTPREHRLRVARLARIYSLGALQAPEAWVVLHGYGQLAARFITQFAALAGDERCIVAPEALNRFYLDPPRPGGPSADERRVGSTWMTREDREAEIADYVAYLDQVCATLLPASARITAFGFSQGVATAARWVAQGSYPVERLILWAGTLPSDADFRQLGGRLTAPLDIVVGERDEFAARHVFEEGVRLLGEAGVGYRLRRFDGGHEIDGGLLADLATGA